MSAQAQKFRIFEKKALSGCPLSVLNTKLTILPYIELKSVFMVFGIYNFCTSFRGQWPHLGNISDKVLCNLGLEAILMHITLWQEFKIQAQNHGA